MVDRQELKRMVTVKNKQGRVLKPKGMTLSELSKVKQSVGLDLFELPARTRPRNPVEAEVLKQWENERGGKAIGDIGGGVKQMANDQKQTLSAKVPKQLKEKVKEEAIKKGKNVSEYVSEMLSTDWVGKEEVHKAEVAELKRQLKEKDTLILRLTDSLEREQNLVDQQQQLQLQSQQRVKELEQKEQLFIESNSNQKWWKFWG